MEIKVAVTQLGAGEVTQLLRAYSSGDQNAFDQLIQMYAPELEKLARTCLNGDAMRNYFDTRSLVVEYWLKQSKAKGISAVNERAFRSFIYRGMRRIITDRARMHRARIQTISAEEQQEPQQPLETPENKIKNLDLEQAMDALDAAIPGMGILAELKFRGYTQKEISEIMNITVNDVQRQWATCKDFLKAHLQE